MNSDLQKSGLPLDAVCGEIDIRIDRTGQWFHEGSPIGRIELVRLFATVLNKDAGGNYWLETPVEKGRIQVEDVPFMAVIMKLRNSRFTVSNSLENPLMLPALRGQVRSSFPTSGTLHFEHR